MFIFRISNNHSSVIPRTAIDIIIFLRKLIIYGVIFIILTLQKNITNTIHINYSSFDKNIFYNNKRKCFCCKYDVNVYIMF